MSNSEYHQQMKKGKWEPKKSRTTVNCSTDLPFSPDNEFVELLWENGQIVMQGQNNKPKKNHVSSMLPSNLTSNGEDAILPIPPKGGKFGPLDIVAHEFSSCTSAAVGLVQDDDMVPWFNCPFDYSLEREYCSEFLAEMSVLNKNSMSAQTSSAVSDKTATLSNSVMPSVQNCANLEPENSYKESSLVSDINAAVTGSSRVRSSELIHSAQSQVSTQGARSKPIDFCADDSFREPPQHSTPMPVSVITPHSIKPIHSAAKASEPVHSGSMMNFCHFSLPAALSKSNLQSIGMAAANVPVTDPFRKNNRLIAADNKTVEPSVVDSNSLKQIASCFKQMNGCNKMFSFQHPQCELLSWKDMNLGDKMATHVLPHIDAEDVGCQEDLAGRCRASDQKLSHSPSFAANTTVVGRSNGGKVVEPVVASSSVCSGSSAGRSVEDAKHVPKGNSKEIEESGYRSEDVEEESVGARKPSTSKSTSTKRSRAAEVHNLSERRRRDRINEKMRALQELIPNCNKTDKASMLDEAIEYLKTLQLQVQMMSMGSGMCIPPMMLPAGMRHMHFSPGGVGMGMGYGMGMVDMGCSSACPMIRMPPMHGGPSLPCIPGSGVPVFGVPGHGLPVAMPRAQFMPFPVFPAKPVSLPETSSATAMMPASESVPLSTSKSPPDDANNIPVNYSNSQQIQKTQSPLQSNTASVTHQIGRSKVNAVLNTAQTDGAAASAEDRSD